VKGSEGGPAICIACQPRGTDMLEGQRDLVLRTHAKMALNERSLQGLTSLALEDDAMRSSDIRRLIHMCTTRRIRNIAALICT